jgi:predicted  nucleic acid-binding Zn-ribbon protein
MRNLRIVILALTAGAVFTLSASPAAVAGQLRTEWQAKKQALVDAHVKFDGMNQDDFGPRLDTFETAKKAHSDNRDAGKKAKLQTALDKAIADAKETGMKYHTQITYLWEAATHRTDQDQQTKDEAKVTLAAVSWLISTINTKLKY